MTPRRPAQPVVQKKKTKKSNTCLPNFTLERLEKKPVAAREQCRTMLVKKTEELRRSMDQSRAVEKANHVIRKQNSLTELKIQAVIDSRNFAKKMVENGKRIIRCFSFVRIEPNTSLLMEIDRSLRHVIKNEAAIWKRNVEQHEWFKKFDQSREIVAAENREIAEKERLLRTIEREADTRIAVGEILPTLESLSYDEWKLAIKQFLCPEILEEQKRALPELTEEPKEPIFTHDKKRRIFHDHESDFESDSSDSEGNSFSDFFDDV